jgi:ribosomal protein S21
MNKKFKNNKSRIRKYDKEPSGTIEVQARRGEDPDALIRRFKRMMKKSGLQMEIRSRSLGRFKSKGEKRREKHKKAVQRALPKKIKNDFSRKF